MTPSDVPKKPTIRDVAAAAGVSYGTVSRVLNGGHWVSPEARAAVDAAIVSTGYTTNQAARSLATGKTGSLAFLLTESQHVLLSDPNMALLLRGATDAVSERGMTLVLLIADTEREQANAARYVRAGHVDGVLLVPSHESDDLLGSLVNAGVPTVCSGIPLWEGRTVAHVAIDEVGSARTMTRHLMDGGRRRIALITGPLDTPSGRFRLDGFRDELGDRFDEDLVEVVPFTREAGAEAMARLLARAPDVDAVFAASDLLAVGAAQTLAAQGRRIPQDVALAGFDDSGLAEAHTPPLTTIRQPWAQISATMVEMVLEAIAGGHPDAVVLPTTLVVRESA